MSDLAPVPEVDGWRLLRERIEPTERRIGWIAALVGSALALATLSGSVLATAASALGSVLLGCAGGIAHAHGRVTRLRCNPEPFAKAYRESVAFDALPLREKLLHSIGRRSPRTTVPVPLLPTLAYTTFVLAAIAVLALLPRIWAGVLAPPATLLLCAGGYYLGAAGATRRIARHTSTE